MRFKSGNTWFETYKKSKTHRSHSGLGGALLSALIVPLYAQGAVTLEASSPYEISDSDIVYFSADPAFSGIMDESAGFQNFDLSVGQASDSDADGDGLGDQMLRFNITSSESFADAATDTPLIITVFATAQNGGDLIPVPIAAVGGSPCSSSRCQDDIESNGVTYYLSALSTSSSTGVSAVEVGIYPKDICEVVYAQSPGAPAVGCTNDAVDAPTSSSPTTLTLTFAVGVATDISSSLDPDTVDEKSDALTLSLHAAAPSFSCPSMTEAYTPGDGQISITTAFADAGSTGNAPLDQLIVVGAEGAVPLISDSTFATVNAIVGRLDIDSGSQTLSGFTNTTDGTDHLYSLRFSVRDSSGRVAPFETTSSCILDNVQTSEIQGFLGKTQCFIATATFQSDRHPAVLLLRRFRDEILLQSWLGAQWVDFYYAWSPQAAQWLIRHGEWRPFVQVALAPLIGLVGVIMYPSVAGCLLVLIVGLAIARHQKTKRTPVSVRTFIQSGSIVFFILHLISCAGSSARKESPTGTVENDPNAPYIAKIKKSLESDSKAEKPGEWIEKQRLTLQAESPAEESNYLTQVQAALKREDADGESGGSFIEAQKKRIQSEEEGSGSTPTTSLIADVKAGIQSRPPEKDGNIHHAMGFKLGASIQRTVNAAAGSGTGTAFDVIYATQLAPDFNLTYEFQPFHSEWLGSLGFGGQTGFALYQGFGNYTVSLPGFGTVSDTRFRFLFMPVFLTATYRFNLLRVVRPFVQAGAGLNYFREWREDSGQSLQGYSRALMFTGGVAVNLDFLMNRSGWGLYEELGIQHSYLTIDYTRYRHLSGDLSMQASGIQAGLTYEF